MRSILLQIAAVIRMDLKGSVRRVWSSLSIILSIALVVVVLLSLLAMANGFRLTVARSGSDDIAVMLRAGVLSELNSTVTLDQVRLIETAPGVARTAEGRPLVSAELYIVVNGIKKATGRTANLPLRGIGPLGQELRKNVRMVEGRMMSPGSNEIVVGRAVQRQFRGFDLGDKITLGPSSWTVVGVFEAGGSVFDSEIWADYAVIQSLFRRINSFQTIRVRLQSPAALDPLVAYVAADPRLALDVKSEAAYFSDQALRTSDLIQKLGWPLALIMGFGALAGALNTMYSSVAARMTQIATLRAIGFGGFASFVGTLVEALILAACGGLIGAAATLLLFDGLTTSTLSGNMTQIEFSFRLTPALIVQAILLALSVGLIGGLFPALRAARAPIATALHAH